jgi:hypothetical protein
MSPQFQPNTSKGKQRQLSPRAASLRCRVGLCLLWLALCLPAPSLHAATREQPPTRKDLAAALASQDSNAVSRIVSEIRKNLGDKAGVPEIRELFRPIPVDARCLSRSEAIRAFEPCLRRIEQAKWWRVNLDPTKLQHALREPASIVSGCQLAHRAKLENSGKCLHLAREAGNFLLWAQEQAGTGVFPFPAVRGITGDNAFVAADRYLARAERERRLPEVVHNGWIINDTGDGGLQFDNGEVGVAMFELFEATGEKNYLASAVKAADWAAARPLVPNWNYNSFSVYLLAKAFAVTKLEKYRVVAIGKAQVGLLPGQLKDGPCAGRWMDGHNARPAYHYIMLRSLAQLAAVIPANDPTRVEILNALRMGLKARNRDFVERGAPNMDKALETLLMVNRMFANDRAFLAESSSDQALDLLARLVSDEYRRGELPVAPREWGMFLEFTLERPLDRIDSPAGEGSESAR